MRGQHQAHFNQHSYPDSLFSFSNLNQINIVLAACTRLHLFHWSWFHPWTCEQRAREAKGKKGNIDFNLFNWAALIWMLIKVLPDDPRFELGSHCGAAAVAFMLSSSVETQLIVRLAPRSPPLLIAFTSAVFHGMSVSSRPQVTPLVTSKRSMHWPCAGCVLSMDTAFLYREK